MSHDTAAESRDPLFESDPNPPLPHDEFPESELSTVVEPQADGSRRCIFYPDEEDEVTAEQRWLAVDNELVVSVSRWR